MKPQSPARALRVGSPGFEVDDEFKIHFRDFAADEIQPAVDVAFIDACVHRVHQELLAVHGPGAAIGGVNRGAYPFEVADRVTGDAWMYICRLRNK